VLPAAPPPPPSSGVPLSCQNTPTPVAELQSFSTTTIAINAIDDSNNDEHHPKQQLFLHERTFLSSSRGQVFREGKVRRTSKKRGGGQNFNRADLQSQIA